jgi:hypothetical protein
MVGDVNADGKVDVKDIFAVGKAYGTSREGPNPPGRAYSPNCDINGDNKVDAKDYYIVNKHYGEVDHRHDSDRHNGSLTHRTIISALLHDQNTFLMNPDDITHHENRTPHH